jgi:hypothetical protein
MNGVRTLLAVLILLLSIMLRTQASLPDALEANPQEPTVSTPAMLTPVGSAIPSLAC